MLYWPEQRMLVFSDLHLEKASYLAQFRAPVPLYDSVDTLLAMERLIEAYAPEQVLCLGDSFHDSKGFARLDERARGVLECLVASVPQWHWVEGNHDNSLKDIAGNNSVANLECANILFSHEPAQHAPYQIIGHLHPKAQVKLHGHKVRGSCFLVSNTTLIMPAFGAFTGGLMFPHEAFNAFGKNIFKTYIIYKNKIFLL